MESIIKYTLLFNGIKYKQYNKIETFLFTINILHMIFSYVPVFYIFYNLFLSFNIGKILLLGIYLIDILNIYYCNNLSFLKIISRNYNNYLKPKFKKLLIFITIFNFILSLIISIIFVFLLSNNYQFTIFNDFNIPFSLKCYFLFFLTLYSSYSKLNVLTYFIIFGYNIFYVLDNFIKNVKNNDKKILRISYKFLDIRHRFNYLIYAFNISLSNIVFFGILPIIYFIKNITKLYFCPQYYFFIIYFTIFCFIYHNFTCKIVESISYLRSYSDKTKNIKYNFFRKMNITNLEDIEFMQIQDNILNFKSYILDIENSNLLDWFIFSQILQQDWKGIQVFGINIQHNTLITKIISVIIIVILGPEFI